jgi:hypothetical protein
VFEALLARGKLEEALSRLRRIAVLLHGTEDRVDGLTADEAHALDGEVCRLSVAALDVSSANPTRMLRFAAWVARADYHLPLEIFTDCLRPLPRQRAAAALVPHPPRRHGSPLTAAALRSRRPDRLSGVAVVAGCQV